MFDEKMKSGSYVSQGYYCDIPRKDTPDFFGLNLSSTREGKSSLDFKLQFQRNFLSEDDERTKENEMLFSMLVNNKKNANKDILEKIEIFLQSPEMSQIQSMEKYQMLGECLFKTNSINNSPYSTKEEISKSLKLQSEILAKMITFTEEQLKDFENGATNIKIVY